MMEMILYSIFGFYILTLVVKLYGKQIDKLEEKIWKWYFRKF